MNNQSLKKRTARTPAWRAPALMAFMAMGATLLPAGASTAGDQAAPQDYSVRPILVGAGGIRMQGDGWTLDGSVGQPALTVQTGAGSLRLESGFWYASSATAIADDTIFANGFDPAAGGFAPPLPH